jgi:carbamate kinase
MIVITLGGNAILPGHGKGTIQEQFAVATEAMAGVAEVIASGQPVVLSHGNGPIVGNIAIRNEAAKDRVPPMPLDVCGADSQGGIGYMLQQVLDNELGKRGIRRTVVSLVTQCVVHEDDPAFDNPTKSIGPFYTEEESVYLARTKSWRLVEDSGRGYRRVVPSPIPREIVEWEAIRALVDAGIVVIAAGGGGIPVVRRDGRLSGVEAVIDKDRASAVLASQLSAERLVVLTAVARVAVDFGRPTQRDLDRIEVAEARRLQREGQSPPWSMGPKIEACADFVEAGGREAIITSPENLMSALAHESGTRVVPDGSP